MNNNWKMVQGMILVLFVFTASYAFGAEVLFVVGKKGVVGKREMRAGDLCIKNHLEDRGFNVTVQEDTSVKSEDAFSRDLVILSESARSREIGTKFRDVAVPVICSEPWIFTKLGMTGQTKRIDFGRKSRQKEMIILNSDHPLCASCSQKVQVSQRCFYMGWGIPGENAIAVAALPGDPDKCTIFAYETGTEMPGCVALARRVGLFMFRNTAECLTDDGWSLFDAAVDWSISNTQTIIEAGAKTENVEE